ncbi:GTPase Era [Candidatus Uhrbacteria bacterium]|nr:GTPase Era [Candidatus Uhrbacteria bacterium]
MKSGFVTFVGRSNVGKSTLLNALVGSKVAIVTPKPQTTRHPVRGILHDPRGQIVFVDTPGIFLGKKDAVSRELNKIVREQIEGIEAIVYVVDPTREPGAEEAHLQELLKKTRVPIIVAVNKNDLPILRRPFLKNTLILDVGQRATMEISAIKHRELNKLIDTLFDLLPEGEAFYPEHQLTDLSHADWIAEVIREKVFLHLQEELPYSVHVEVTETNMRDDEHEKISATVWTTEERYKGMIIGAKGEMVKTIGSDARKELESATGKKIFLGLDVQVDPKWQERFNKA